MVMYVLFLLVLTEVALATEWIYERDTELDGSIYGNQISTTTVSTVEDCALICSHTTSCLSFTYLQNQCRAYDDYFFSSISPQIAVGSQTYKIKQDNTVQNCSNGFILDTNELFCYKIVATEKSWFDAASECMSMKSSLFMMDSDSKLEAYKEIMKKTSVTYWWTGGYDVTSKNKDWIWMNGKPIMTNLWRPGEPNGVHEKCAEARYNIRLLNDRQCSSNRSFICEQSLQT